MAKKNVEIIGFCSYAASEKAALYYGREYIEWGLNYIKERAKRKIFARFIADDSPQGHERQALDKEEYREIRLIPAEKLPFAVEVDIYEDWVILMSIKDLIGLAIESKEIAAILKTAFDLSWEAAEKYQKSSQ
ncbi:MAG: transcriptional regulator [Candidatus Berkelbacteria bacterium]|nr:transcriptional regulator [Candidatus Berkelbacteria bacterium]